MKINLSLEISPEELSTLVRRLSSPGEMPDASQVVETERAADPQPDWIGIGLAALQRWGEASVRKG